MENSIQIFKHEMFGSLRTMRMPDGQIGFVGKDVAEALGYKNPSNALVTHVEEEDKTSYLIQVSGSNYKANTTIINESGLYALVLSSKLPTARKFKHWVTSEVLPQIRKTGGYIPVSREDDEKTILCKALHIMQNTVALRDREIAEKKQKIAELAPLADYADQVLLSPKCYTMTEIAKFEGMTVQNLQHLLHELRIIYRSPSGPFMLYADHLGKGYEAYRTRKGCDLFGNVLYTNTYLVWTEQGRKFIHDYLKCPFVNEIA
ncbi:MAG: phage antirepressor KilAC domain-containing protein [Bacteroidaceae bacterium]|nr:phage antirepressor KilAC domain-containing protein [Bacteroidaceae bacterium]